MLISCSKICTQCPVRRKYQKNVDVRKGTKDGHVEVNVKKQTRSEFSLDHHRVRIPPLQIPALASLSSLPIGDHLGSMDRWMMLLFLLQTDSSCLNTQTSESYGRSLHSQGDGLLAVGITNPTAGSRLSVPTCSPCWHVPRLHSYSR